MSARTFKGYQYRARPRRVGAPASRYVRRRAALYRQRPVPYMARVSTGELKFFDTDVDDATVAAGMNIQNLCIVPEGNGESARIGRKMTIKKIHVKGSIELFAASTFTTSSDTVICMLVQDTQTNGAAFVATDLIDTDIFKSFRNLANSKRFNVLYSRTFALKVSGGAPSGAALIRGEDRRTLSVNVNVNIPIEYDNSATTGVITSVRTNNVYWVTQSASAACAIIADARIRYTDV